MKRNKLDPHLRPDIEARLIGLVWIVLGLILIALVVSTLMDPGC